jgi:hypothetical protein
MKVINLIKVRIGGFLWWGGMEKYCVSLDDFNESQRQCYSLQQQMASLIDNIPTEYCLNVLTSECLCNKSSKYKNGRDDEWGKAAAWLVMVMDVKNADR